jgi:outer membrane biosynthesis protein TonB
MAVQRSKSKGHISTSGAGSRKRKISTAASGPKVLRIGIIQGGRIIEERIIRKRDTVAVGQSEKNTFVVVSNAIPSRFEMFENRGGGHYTLQFTETMQGRISFKGDVKELSELRSSGAAKRRGRVYRFPLNEKARGKVVVGDSTILFQFVDPPPIQPRPQLPAAAQGGLFKDIEWFITTAWIVSFLLHTGFLTFLETHDWPVISRWERYMQLEELISTTDATFEKKKEKKVEDGEGEEVEEEEAEEEEEKPEKKVAEKSEKTTKKSAEEIQRERAEKRALIAEQLAQRGINKIIGSLGGDGEGAIVDVLSQGDVGADQDELLKQVQGIDVATGDANRLRGPAGGKGSGVAADIGQVRMKGGDADVNTGGAGSERKVKGQVKRKEASAIDGTGALNPQEVNKVIGRRMGAIKGCYERALRRDPNLQGKLVIRFTIAGSGRVTTARAVENALTPEVGNCVVSAFKRFRFPQPDGGSLTMESPFMFMPSN